MILILFKHKALLFFYIHRCYSRLFLCFCTHYSYRYKYFRKKLEFRVMGGYG